MPALPSFESSGRKANLESLNGPVTHHDRNSADSFQNAIDSHDEHNSSDSRHNLSQTAAAAAAAVAVVADDHPGSDSELESQHIARQAKSKTDKDINGNESPSPTEKLSPEGHNGGLSVIGGLSSRKIYECQVCGWRFALKGNLIAHLRRHTGEKPYECTVCHRKFTQSSLLTVHMRTHTGEKPFKCSKCGRSFSRSGNLTTHMRTHSSQKPYGCAFCNKSFSQRVNMELHTRVHTGVKPYRCGVCNRAFTSCSNMRRHWRHIHPSYPEPAAGTTHLLHGMPEKSLYPEATTSTPVFRAEDANFSEEHPTEASVAPSAPVSVSESMSSALPSSHGEQLSSHLLASHGIGGLGGTNSHHEIGSSAVGGNILRSQAANVYNESQTVLPSMISQLSNAQLNQHLAAQLAAQMSNQFSAQIVSHNGYGGIPTGLASRQLNHSQAGIAHHLPLLPHIDVHNPSMAPVGGHSIYQSQMPTSHYSINPQHYARASQPVSKSSGQQLPLERSEEYDPAMKESDGRISASATADS